MATNALGNVVEFGEVTKAFGDVLFLEAAAHVPPQAAGMAAGVATGAAGVAVAAGLGY